MYRYTLLILLFSLLSYACSSDKPKKILQLDDETTIPKPLPKDTTMQPTIDSMPMDTMIPVDTVKKVEKPSRKPAKAKFENKIHDYGWITEGDTVNYTFVLENVGERPLEIERIDKTCGCTKPVYDQLPIAPKEKSEIKVQYLSEGKVGRQESLLTLYTNGDPQKYVLTLKGIIRERPKKTE